MRRVRTLAPSRDVVGEAAPAGMANTIQKTVNDARKIAELKRRPSLPPQTRRSRYDWLLAAPRGEALLLERGKHFPEHVSTDSLRSTLRNWGLRREVAVTVRTCVLDPDTNRPYPKQEANGKPLPWGVWVTLEPAPAD